MVRTVLVGAVLSIGLAIYPASVTWAGWQKDAICQGGCGGGCGPCSGAASVPAGPSPEKLKEQAEAKDLNEAAQDADDKGVAAYNKGDFAGAVQDFREALSDAPDDNDIQHNLQRAQQKLSESEAARHLMTAVHHSEAAAPLTNEPASAEARRGFDDSGSPAGNLQGPAVCAPLWGSRDPVVPASKRTQHITDLEHQRADTRKNIAALEIIRKTLDPKVDAVKISEIKQKESQKEQTVHYLNLSISADLEKPQATAGNAPAKP